jgi:hypothetical protein
MNRAQSTKMVLEIFQIRIPEGYSYFILYALCFIL